MHLQIIQYFPGLLRGQVLLIFRDQCRSFPVNLFGLFSKSGCLF